MGQIYTLRNVIFKQINEKFNSDNNMDYELYLPSDVAATRVEYDDQDSDFPNKEVMFVSVGDALSKPLGSQIGMPVK